MREPSGEIRGSDALTSSQTSFGCIPGTRPDSKGTASTGGRDNRPGASVVRGGQRVDEADEGGGGRAGGEDREPEHRERDPRRVDEKTRHDRAMNPAPVPAALRGWCTSTSTE